MTSRHAYGNKHMEMAYMDGDKPLTRQMPIYCDPAWKCIHENYYYWSRKMKTSFEMHRIPWRHPGRFGAGLEKPVYKPVCLKTFLFFLTLLANVTQSLVATCKSCPAACIVSCLLFSWRIAWNFHGIPVAVVLWLWDKRNYCLQVLMTSQFHQMDTSIPRFWASVFISLNLCNPYCSLTICQRRLPCCKIGGGGVLL